MNATSPTNDNEALTFLKTVIDAERLKIVGLLAVRPYRLSEIAEQLHQRPSEVNNHLEHLTGLGIVRLENEMYSLSSEALAGLARRQLAGERTKPAAAELSGETYDRKVLYDYLNADGALKQIPMQQKKLLVILRYVVQVFESGQQYPEKQVNQMLRRYHEDTAALRRYLVDYKMMARDKGVYWRVNEPEKTE